MGDRNGVGKHKNQRYDDVERIYQDLKKDGYNRSKIDIKEALFANKYDVAKTIMAMKDQNFKPWKSYYRDHRNNKHRNDGNKTVTITFSSNEPQKREHANNKHTERNVEHQEGNRSGRQYQYVFAPTNDCDDIFEDKKVPQQANSYTYYYHAQLQPVYYYFGQMPVPYPHAIQVYALPEGTIVQLQNGKHARVTYQTLSASEEREYLEKCGHK